MKFVLMFVISILFFPSVKAEIIYQSSAKVSCADSMQTLDLFFQNGKITLYNNESEITSLRFLTENSEDYLYLAHENFMVLNKNQELVLGEAIKMTILLAKNPAQTEQMGLVEVMWQGRIVATLTCHGGKP